MSLENLYQKIAEFNAQISDGAQAKSNCQQGCSRCCYVDLTVFEIEARAIANWHRALSTDQQDKLKRQWKKPTPVKENFFHKQTAACPFLKEESCTIYEVRPLICRSQGLPLTFKIDQSWMQDLCPLNQEMQPELEKKDWLNLDLLNTILAHLELLDANKIERPRKSLRTLQAELLSQPKNP